MISDKTIIEVLKMYKEGVETLEICKSTSVKRQQVYAWAKMAGIKRQKGHDWDLIISKLK